MELHQHKENASEDKKVGTALGDICPICQAGEVVNAGGCNTCSTCGSQIKCGI